MAVDENNAQEYRQSRNQWELELFPKRARILFTCLLTLTVLGVTICGAAWFHFHDANPAPKASPPPSNEGVGETEESHSRFGPEALAAGVVGLIFISVWWFFFEWWRLIDRHAKFVDDLPNDAPPTSFSSYRPSVLLDRTGLRSTLAVLLLLTFLCIAICVQLLQPSRGSSQHSKATALRTSQSITKIISFEYQTAIKGGPACRLGPLSRPDHNTSWTGQGCLVGGMMGVA